MGQDQSRGPTFAKESAVHESQITKHTLGWPRRCEPRAGCRRR